MASECATSCGEKQRKRRRKSYSREVFEFSFSLIFVQGNAASEALLGGRGSTESKQQDYDLQQQNHEPCRYELQRFVECAPNQSEVTLRKDFSEAALKQCKQVNSECCSILKVYLTTIRLILEYGVQAWQDIPEFLSNKLESIQKRALHIIYPCICHSYLDALNITNLDSLKERRTQLCCKYVQKLSKISHLIKRCLEMK